MAQLSTRVLQYICSVCAVGWATLDVRLHGVAGGMSSAEVDKHLEMGKQLLQQGQLQDALTHYHAAVDGDPSNYLTYFKRATVYLAIGRSKAALPDLDKVVQLKPDFLQARVQRGSVLLKRADLDAAHADYEFVLSKNPDHAEARAQLDSIEPLKTLITQAEQAKEAHDFGGAVAMLGQVIEKIPWSASLRELRADSYINIGDYHNAMADIRATTKLVSDNTRAYFRLSQLYYQLGELEDTLREVRECLKLDPDHKDCFPFYKKVKKLNKQFVSAEDHIANQRFEEAIAKFNSALKTEPAMHIYQSRARTRICHCYSKLQQIKEAVETCSKVLEEDPQNVDALCDRAEAYLLDEKFDEAVQDYQTATQVEGHPRKADEGLQRAQKLLKQSQRRDYYKILGVKRNAKKGEILKAYRRKAIKWHPDHYRGKDKKKAEKMFIDLAAAKEVLADPEKRAKFDAGEDPLDPEQQQGQGFPGGFPFPFGGPGGGGNFQFKFHFG